MERFSTELSLLSKAIAYPNLSTASVQIGVSQPQLSRTIMKLEQELKVAKEIGASEGFILSLIEEIIDTKYKNSPSEAKKQKILLALDPFPSMSIMEIAELIKAGVPIDPNDLTLKANFGNLVGELERLNRVDLENELFDAIVIQFSKEFIHSFTNCEEAAAIKQMLENANRGIAFSEHKEIANAIIEMLSMDGYPKILKLISILNELSEMQYQFIAPNTFHTIASKKSERRINEICLFIQKNFKNLE